MKKLKIAVIKHLIVPKLLFSSQFFKHLVVLLRNLTIFYMTSYWNSKYRIKCNMLMSDIQLGALEMIDFESKVKAIRANRMPILKQEASDGSLEINI